MKILKCTSGTIYIQLDNDFSNIIIKAIGERIEKGFCLSIDSITQEEPIAKKLEKNIQKQIANRISNFKDLEMYLEFYEEL